MSATTRNNLLGAYVRLWHLADMINALTMSAIGGKADMTRTGRYVG